MGIARGLALVAGAVAVVAAVGGSGGTGCVVQLALAGAVVIFWPRGQGSVGSGLAAVLLAPVVVGGLHGGDAWGAVSLLGCLVVLSLRQGRLPVAVPGTLLALALVEAGRSLVVASAFPPALVCVAPVVLAGVGAAACASLPQPPRVSGVGLLVAALALAVWGARKEPHATTVRGRLTQLAEAPRSHASALALAEQHGVALPLAAGWSPQGAPLTPAQRVDAARWLDMRGRGGEGRRLLREAREQPAVAWWWLLARRVEGLPESGGVPTSAPTEALSLPGTHRLDLEMLTNGARDLLVDVKEPCALQLEAHGDAWRGAAELEVQVDRQAATRFSLESVATTLLLPLPETGPHRVRLRFDNDLDGPGGDRNVYVTGLTCGALMSE